MSMQELTEGLAIIEANPRRAHFAGPREAALVSAAETAIGAVFPPTYREFVQRLGAGNFGSFEVYGVIDADFESGPIPNGIWLTLDERRVSKLPANLLVIASTGDGAYYCLELRGGREGPVVIYQPGLPPEEQLLERVADDFGQFFLAEVRQQLS
jgi:hypothetical protein